jgi:hypothetical protein
MKKILTIIILLGIAFFIGLDFYIESSATTIEEAAVEFFDVNSDGDSKHSFLHYFASSLFITTHNFIFDSVVKYSNFNYLVYYCPVGQSNYLKYFISSRATFI